MHNTEVKSDNSKTTTTTESYQHRLNMTNGEVGVARHHREAGAPGLAGTRNECAGCGKKITDRFLLKALDMFWHEDCLKCGCCDCRLGEVGSSCYTKANLILCKRDYLRLFGNTGYCAACSKVIPAFEMVMRARNNVYHLECFACQQCNHRFCVGDRFYLCENKILCEYDYEERMVFANMAYSPGNLALLRRQVTNFQQPGVADQQQQRQCSQYEQHHLEKSQQSLPVGKVAVSESVVNSVNGSSSSPSSSNTHSPENGHVMNCWGNATQHPNYYATMRSPSSHNFEEYQRAFAARQQQQQHHPHQHYVLPPSHASSVLSGSSSNAADDNISTSPDSGIVEGP